MSRIRSGNTKPELIVRGLLHRMGFRFRVHRRDLPGKPDIVLPKYKTVIFVHGCFWHRHERCKKATMPATNREFWQDKFNANVARDQRNRDALRRAGWKVVVAWECRISADPIGTVREIAEQITGASPRRPYPLPERKEVLRAAEERLQYSLDGRNRRPTPP